MNLSHSTPRCTPTTTPDRNSSNAVCRRVAGGVHRLRHWPAASRRFCGWDGAVSISGTFHFYVVGTNPPKHDMALLGETRPTTRAPRTRQKRVYHTPKDWCYKVHIDSSHHRVARRGIIWHDGSHVLGGRTSLGLDFRLLDADFTQHILPKTTHQLAVLNAISDLHFFAESS